MLRKHNIITQIIEDGVVAVIRADSASDAEKIVLACLEGGVRSIELTFTVDGAATIIEKLHKSIGDKCTLGAGTVLDSETARVAILAGAKYIVSPSFDKGTALLCNRYAVPYMAGCFTPKEAVEAMSFGVDVIKLFPGGLVGPKAIKAFKGPLPQANIMPTGGVSLDNAKDWIDAGAVALGVGGDLVSGAKTGNFGEITEKAKAYVNAVKEARK